jgi:hypothetical protein
MTRWGCLWAIIKPLGVLTVVVGLLTAAAFPWAIPLPGRDSLSGSWIGELRSNQGPQAWLFLSLGPARGYRPRLFGFVTGSGTPLGGDAVLCTARVRIDLSVSGSTTMWSGKRIDILLRPVEPSPPQLRLEILGTWDGDSLEFTQRNRSLADILSESGGVDTVPERSRFVSARLRKAPRVEFDSACGRLTPGEHEGVGR